LFCGQKIGKESRDVERKTTEKGVRWKDDGDGSRVKRNKELGWKTKEDGDEKTMERKTEVI
jgi:hypothetical protein